MAPALLDPLGNVEKILDVAERLLVERGYEHTTMI
ncbi:TetR/AcrR family transcriptional regulator [Collinsella sp. AK_207A]|nr:TetR/AcrR family transcriptional regulator [Collinsella sp. AK_207A]